MKTLDLKKFRKELNFTQDDLAKKLGVSKNTVWNWENGTKIPDSKLPMLMEILNIFFDPNEKIYKFDDEILNFHEPKAEYIAKFYDSEEKRNLKIIQLEEKILEYLQMLLDKNTDIQKLTNDLLETRKEYYEMKKLVLK